MHMMKLAPSNWLDTLVLDDGSIELQPWVQHHVESCATHKVPINDARFLACQAIDLFCGSCFGWDDSENDVVLSWHDDYHSDLIRPGRTVQLVSAEELILYARSVLIGKYSKPDSFMSYVCGYGGLSDRSLAQSLSVETILCVDTCIRHVINHDISRAMQWQGVAWANFNQASAHAHADYHIVSAL